MGCYTERQLRQLRENAAKRKLDQARLANYKPLYLAARAARDYLKDVIPTSSTALVAQLDAALIDPRPKAQEN